MAELDTPIIFIVGNSRSGTTMLARCLGRHSSIYQFEELHFFEQFIAPEQLTTPPTLPKAKAIKLTERLITTTRDGLFASVTEGQYTKEAEDVVGANEPLTAMSIYNDILLCETRKAGKVIPLEQTPRYLFLAENILEAFPNAHIVNLIRDPRDVMLSQKNRWKRGRYSDNGVPLIWTLRSWANYHAYLTPRIWSGAVKKSKAMEYHARFHTIGYESILKEPRKALQNLLDKLGLELEESLFQVRQIGSSTGQDKPESTGFDATRIGAWQKGGLSNAEIAICEKLAKDEMVYAGYNLSGVKGSFLGNGLKKLTLLPKLAFATCLNLSRFKSLGRVVTKRLNPNPNKVS